MSMIGNLARIPETVRLALHQNPEAIFGVLYPDSLEQPEKKPGFFARLFGKQPVPASETSHDVALHTLSEADTVDIDKTWHALHFLFTGTAWEGDFPQGFLVTSGEPVGEADVGYGPARSFSPAQVKEIAAFLSRLDKSELKSRLVPEKLEEKEIYPSIWKNCQNLEEEWAYFEGGLDQIVPFVSDTARKDMALLVYLN